MEKKTDLTIVILSYNVEKLILDCLRSIAKAKKPRDKWRIIIPDNGSHDNSVVKIKKLFPDVEVIENHKNLGFAAGNNIGLIKSRSTYTLLLNPDTYVFPDTIHTVMKYMDKNPDVGAATCRVELPDGSLDYSCHRRFPNPWNSFIYFFTGIFRKLSSYSDSNIPNAVHEIDALCGAFAMIRTDVGKKLRWLDEDFWWNGEDLDFCYRIKEKGLKIVFIPQVKIIHFKGSSSGLQKSARVKVAKEIRLRSAMSGLSAMKIFYDKHYAAKYPFFFNWFIYTGIFALKLLRIFKIRILNSQI